MRSPVALSRHAFGEIFEIHLVHDADAGRNDTEGLERLLAPFQKLDNARGCA